MLREFFKDSAIFGAMSVSTRLIWFLALPILTRYLSPTSFGILEMVLLMGAILPPLISLEIASGFGRFFNVDLKIEEQQQLASTNFWFFVLSAIVLIIVGGVGAQWWLNLLGIESMGITFWWIVIFFVVTLMFFNVQMIYLRWTQQAIGYFWANLCQVFLGVVVGTLGIFYLNWGLAEFLLMLAVGYVIAWIISWPRVKHLYKISFDFSALKQMLRFSLPLIPATLGGLLAIWTDRIMINQFLGLNDLGIYSVAYRMGSIGGVVVFGFHMAITPLVYRYHALPDTPQKVETMFRIMLALVLPVLMVIGLFGEEIIGVIIGEEFSSALPLWMPLTIAILLSQFYIFGVGIGVAKKTKYMVLITASSLIINVTLNLIFIPIWGLIGVVIATVMGSLAHITIWMILSQRFYYVPFQWGRYAVGFAMMGAGYLIANQLPIEGWLEWLIKLALFVLMVIGMLLIKMIKPQEIKDGWSLITTKFAKRDKAEQS